MKKLLWIALAVFLIIVAALGVFIATFDSNRYKPAITSQLESVVGNPVQIEDLSLGHNGGISLELKDLRVYSGAKAEGEPAMIVDRASAVFRLARLLKREIEIGSIIISRPQLHILRSGDGAIRVEDGELQEVLGKWLEKKVAGKSEKSETESNQQTPPQEDLVGSLIGGFLKNKS